MAVEIKHTKNGLTVPEDRSNGPEEITMERQFGFWSGCALGIINGCSWALTGATIVVSIYNGGPPGVIYEFIVIGFLYISVYASIAELASAIPSSAGVYHWASVTGGNRWGPMIGFFGGWLNCCAWIFASVATASTSAIQIVQMYALFHPDYIFQRWHVFVCYVGLTWASCLFVMFGQRLLPIFNHIGLFFILAGVTITVLVCAAMPSTTDYGHASSRFVWHDWHNLTGYSSNIWVFVMGLLNGAFALAVPDCTSHVAEEITQPSRNLPRAMFAQLTAGFFTTLIYLIAIFYSITDLDSVVESGVIFPVAVIYQQATRSLSGTFGLLILILIPSVNSIVGAYVTAGRVLWTLGRDNATPFSHFIGIISPRHKNPLNATMVCGVVNMLLGCIYLGSTTAFNAFVDSLVCLISLSYLAAILPNLCSGRKRVTPGNFWMKGWVGYTVNTCACAYILVFLVVFCFPYSQPVTALSMNYSSVMIGGITLGIGALWLWKKRHGYSGFGVGITPISGVDDRVSSEGVSTGVLQKALD